MNLYTYCANDPIHYTDPSGHNYYVDENGKGHVSDITVGWNMGLNPDIIYDHVTFEDHVNVTTGGAKIGSVSGNSDIVNSFKNSNSNTFTYIPENMTIDTISADDRTIINRGIIDTINTGKDSSLVLDNSGEIHNINIGEGGNAKISNSGSIGAITGGAIPEGIDKGMDITNSGTIDYVLTGSNSHNVIDNEGGKLTLETGEGNESIIIAGQKGVSIKDGKGKAVYRLSCGKSVEYVDVKDTIKLQVLIASGYSFDRPKGTGKTGGATIGPDDGIHIPIDLYDPDIDNIFDKADQEMLMYLTIDWYTAETKKDEEKIIKKLQTYRDFLDTPSGKAFTKIGLVTDGIDEFINEATMAIMASGIQFPAELSLDARLVAETSELELLETKYYKQLKLNYQLFAKGESLKLPKTVVSGKGVEVTSTVKGYEFRIDTNKVAPGEGGFHIHVYRDGEEIAKLNGKGGFVETHAGETLLKPSELNKTVRNEINKLVKYVQKGLGE